MIPDEVPKCEHTFGPNPVREGCWYCGGTDGILIPSQWDGLSIHFSIEFDCWIHMCCILKAKEADPTDAEAAIFYDEFFTVREEDPLPLSE